MFNRLMASVLSLMILCNPAYSNPLAHPEDELEDNFELMVWEPEEIETRLLDYELTVWLMPASQMATPIPGYLIKKPDWVEIRRMMDHFEEEYTRIKKAERTLCNSLLEKKDVDCKTLNSQLIDKVDNQNTLIINLKTDKVDLRNNLFWWKVGTGGVGILALSFGLFAISK